MITYNRIEYSKQALDSLLHSDCGDIVIIDQNSTDGTREWLKSQQKNSRFEILFNNENKGIAGAMNQFLEITKGCAYVGKADNDTIVPENWASILFDKAFKNNIDIIQAKHPILKETHPQGFDAWIRTMRQDKNDKSIYYNSFVGGSGIVFNRQKVDKIPETNWKLYGFRQFQRDHPELIKAFCTDVEITLLDTDDNGKAYPEQYADYYKETKRT